MCKNQRAHNKLEPAFLAAVEQIELDATERYLTASGTDF